MASTAYTRHLVHANQLDREFEDFQRARAKTFRVYKNVKGRLVFCDEIAAHSPEAAIELAIRGVHGGLRYQYRTEEKEK